MGWLKIVIRYKLIKLFQKEWINGCKKRVFNMLSEGSFCRSILKGVIILAIVCPRYFVEGKMIVLGRACPSYIVKRFFLKTLPFLNLFVPVSSRKII